MTLQNGFIPENFSPENDHYESFLDSIYRSVTKTIRDENTNHIVYQTDALQKATHNDLFAIFLSNIPEKYRQHYDCHCCRYFVNRFGGLVTIDTQKTKTVSVMFSDIETTPEFFISAIQALKEHVEKSKILRIFATSKPILGFPSHGNFNHMALDTNKLTLDIAKAFHPRYSHNSSESQNMSMDMYRALREALQKYPKAVIDAAYDLINSGTMYRADTVKNDIIMLKTIYPQIDFDNFNSNENKLLLWWIVGKYGRKCFITNSLLGTVLDDILENRSTSYITAHFEEKVDPENYHRSKTGPTVSQIAIAEELIAQEHAEDALKRRYATIQDIKDAGIIIWTNANNAILKDDTKDVVEDTSKKSKGVFSNITPVNAKPKRDDPKVDINIPEQTMSWVKFSSLYLLTNPGRVSRIEVKNDNARKFALVTEAVPGSARKLLKGDKHPEFTWFYGAGIDSEMRRRVTEAGGKYDNCNLRCSLLWNTYSDLDIHCIHFNPLKNNHEHIYYHCRAGWMSNGVLDVDRNVQPETLTPVENIRWLAGERLSDGEYRFYVHNYTNRDHENPYTVELATKDKVYTVSVPDIKHRPIRDIHEYETDAHHIFTVTVVDGEVVDVKAINEKCAVTDVTKKEWKELIAVSLSPNVDVYVMDPDRIVPAGGEHVFLYLEDAEIPENPRGFFVENVRPEFNVIRKTLEAFAASTPIEGEENASALGQGYMIGRPFDLHLKVTMPDGSVKRIKVDRFD